MDKTQPRILLLGGSPQQVIAIKKAKEMGIYTILCDYLPDNPGQFVADKFYNVSTTDVEAVYKVAEQEKVHGILAYASDPAALPAAIVSERLNLPTNPSSSVAILGIKYQFRKFLSDNNFACPQYVTFTPKTSETELKELISKFSFPIIIKPTDSSGSKGVTKIESIHHNLDEAITYASQYSHNQILIAEEFIERGFPYVIGGDIFVKEGKIILFGEMSCLRDNANSALIPIGEKKPSGLDSQQVTIVHKDLQRIINALNIRFGELNIELLIDKQNRVHFLEIGPRAGGNMIPIQLSDIFKVDLVKANIAAAIGIHFDLSLEEQEGCFMHYVLHSYEEGEFDKIEIAPEIEKSVYRKVIYKTEGDKIEFFDGAGKAIGIIFLKFNTIEEMEYFCKNHEQLVKVNLK